MQGKLYKDAEAFNKKYKNRRRWYTALVVMAAVVVFCTTYALIMPAITMEKETFCGLSEHTHSDECYTVNEKTGENQLLCELEEHIHVDDCLNEELFPKIEDLSVETPDAADVTSLQKAPNISKEAGDPNEVTASGSFGSNISWTLTGDGRLTLTGTGDIPDAEYKAPYYGAPWVNYKNDITSVYIGSEITKLGGYLFDRGYSNLTTVEFEEGSKLTQIGSCVFRDCSSLTKIVIPESVTGIGDYAFTNCSSLAEITIPEGVTALGSGAFSGCGSITEITIPAGVKELSSTFSNCTNLKSVTFSENSNLTFLGNSSFSKCTSLTEITVPASVTSLGARLFEYCSNLKSVEFEKGSRVKNIGSNVFGSSTEKEALNALEKITIPASVEVLGKNAFYNCKSLKSVIFEEGSKLKSIGNDAFRNCPLTEVTIPAGVESLGENAFYYCESLKSVTFEEGSKLKSIENYTFYFCPLTEITIPASVERIGAFVFKIGSTGSSIGTLKKVTFEETSVLKSIETQAFSNCPLTEVTIPASVKSIGSDAFYYCTELQHVKFEEGSQLTKIGQEAFCRCSSLTEIKIPQSVETIENSAFKYCSSLTEITIPANVVSVGDSVFIGCTSLQKVEFEEESRLVNIGNYAFGSSSSSECLKLDKIIIPASVESLGNYAFYGIRDISFESGSRLKTVGSSAFYCKYSQKIDRLSAAAALSSNSINSGSSAVTVEINNAYGDVTAEALNQYIKKLYIKRVIVSADVQTVNGDLLYSLTLEKNTELFFEKGAHFTLAEDFSPHNSRYPYLRSGEYYADENSVLYRIDGGKAYLAYCPSAVERLTVPDKIAEYDVIGVDSGAFNTASNVTEVSFEAPASITTVAPYSFANAVKLEKVNGAGSEDAVKAILTGSSQFGAYAFYNTKIAPSSEVSFTLNTDELKPDDYLKIITEFKNLSPNPQKEYTCYTGQSATTTISLTNPKNTASDSSSYIVYFWFLKSNGNLNFSAGNHILLYEVTGKDEKLECSIRVDEMEIPGLYRFSIPSLEPGATLTFDVTSSVSSPGMPGEEMLIWCEKSTQGSATQTNIAVPEKYQMIQWIVHPEKFKVTSPLGDSYGAGFKSDSNGVVSLRGGICANVFSVLQGTKIEGVGEDFVKGIDYLTSFKLSKGMHWNQAVIDAVNAGQWTVEYPSSTYQDIDSTGLIYAEGKYGVIYAYIDGVKTQIGYVNGTTSGYYVDVKDVYFKDGDLCVKFGYENTKATQQNSNGTIGQEIADIKTQVYISSNVIMADEDLIKSGDTTTSLIISGTTSETVHYTHSEDKTDSADFSKSYKLQSAILNLDKRRSDYSSTMGSYNEYTVTAKNDGTFSYNNLKYIVDPLNDILYITPYNLETMLFNDENGKYLTVTIKNAEFCEPLTKPLAVTGADGLEHYIEIGNTANDTPHNGMERNEPPKVGHNVHTTGNTIVLTYSDGGFKITVTDKDGNIIAPYDNKQYTSEHGQIESIFDSIGFIVTEKTQYTVVWAMSDGAEVLRSGESREYKLYTTIKNSFMMISEDKRRNWYENSSPNSKYLNANYAYAYGSEKYPAYPEDGNFNTSRCDKYDSIGGSSLSNDAGIYADYSVNGVSSSSDSTLSISVGDVVDYSVKIEYFNYRYNSYAPYNKFSYRSYDVIPLVDRLNGAQVLLAPVEGNENCDWVSDDIKIYTDENGTEYYILSKAGTYRNVNIGGHLADRIEVNNNPDNGGLETLIYWYMTESSMSQYGSGRINLKAIVSPEYAGITSSGTFQMSNESWLGDHQHHRLWDTVEFEASDIKSGKSIVTSKGKTPAEDELDVHSYLMDGQKVTYRLDIAPTGSPRLRTLDSNSIYDELPESVISNPWKKSDIIEIRFVKADGTPYATVVTNEGEKVIALKNSDNWSVTDSYPGMTESPKPEQQYIMWGDDFELTLYEEPVYIYVTLQMPSGSDWNGYSEAYANKELTNKLYVNGNCSVVYHETAITGEAVLNKGVIGTGYYSLNDTRTFYSNTGENSRIYYSNKDMLGRYAAYYVSLYNSGKSKIYIDDIVDILPQGFSYVAQITDFRSGGLIRTGTTIESSYYNKLFNSIDIVPANGEKVQYRTADVSAKWTITDDGREQRSFNVNYNFNSYSLAYDSSLGKYYLNPGEAFVFAYVCRISDAANTEDIAVNNVAMKYFNYNSAGVKLSDAVVKSKDDVLYKVATVKNDGKGYLYDYGQAAQKGFTGGDTHDKWLASNVSLKRDKIIPGIVKSVNKVTTSTGADSPTSYAQFTDTITWEVTATNDGDYHLQDYIITDVMQYPFRFNGDVKMSFDYLGSLDVSDFTLLIFDKWANDGNSVQVKTSVDGTPYTVTLNNSEWTTVKHTKINSYSSDFGFGVRISQDPDTKNFVLELNMSDSHLSIPEGGGIKLKFSTFRPDKINEISVPMENKIYYNNVYITPNDQEYDDNMVTRGDTVTFNGKPSVHNVAQIFVSYGNVTTSLKEIEQTDDSSNNAISSSTDRNHIIVPNGDTGVTYTLKVKSESAALRKLILIDNLPEIGDHETFDATSPRYSEFTVNLAENPNFRISVDYQDGVHTDIDDSNYVVEYTDKTQFDINDRRGSGADWYSEPKETTRSFRVIITEPNENSDLMAANATVSVKFDAEIVGSPEKGSLAWNSFGYSYNSYATVSEDSYLEASPLKVGVGIPNAPFIKKTLEDDIGNKWAAEKDTQFKFIVYAGDTVEGLNDFTSESEIAALIADRDYTYFDLTVKNGESESEQVQIDRNLYSYNSGWVDTGHMLEWREGEKYNVIELPAANSDYEYGSIGNVSGNCYSFVYHSDKPIHITAINLRNLWQLSVLKTDDKDNALADAVFGLYSPNSEDRLSDEAISELVSSLGLNETPEAAITQGMTTYYLKSIDKTPASGIAYWTTLKEENYFIVELQAPKGYIMSDSIYRADSPDFKPVTVHIVNIEPIYELPSSGGLVLYVYIFGGLITFIVIFLLHRQFKRRKEEISL